MASPSERRRQMILLSILGVLVVVFLARMMLSGGDDSTGTAVTTSQTTGPGGVTTTVPAGTTTTTTHAGTVPPDTFDVYSTRNPFEPAFQETATTSFGSTTTGAGGTTTTTGAGGTTTTTGAGGTTTTTGAGGTTTTTQPSYNPPQGTTVALIDVYVDVSQNPRASVRVASTVYDVGVGDVFGPGSSYRVVSLEGTCGQFLYGDTTFHLCEGQEVIK